MKKNYRKITIVYHVEMSIEDELVEEYWKIRNNHFTNSPCSLAEYNSISTKKLEEYVENTAHLKISTNCVHCNTKIDVEAINQLYAQLVMSYGTVCHVCEGPLIASQVRNKLISGKLKPNINLKPKLLPTGTISLKEDLVLKANTKYNYYLHLKDSKFSMEFFPGKHRIILNPSDDYLGNIQD